MQEFAVKVPDNQVEFFTTLVKNLKFTVVKKDVKPVPPTIKKIIEDIDEGIVEAELHAQGKIKLDDAKTFLLELKKKKAGLKLKN